MSVVALTILKEGVEVAKMSLEGDVSIGRAEGCAVRLDDRAISREHAVIRALEDGFEIHRKSLFAPLWVNGKEITHAIVKQGDWLELGPYRIQIGQSAAVAAAVTAVAAAVSDVGVDFPPEGLVLESPPEEQLVDQPVETPSQAPEIGLSESQPPAESPDSPEMLDISDPLPSSGSEPVVEEPVTEGIGDPDASTRAFGATQVRAVLSLDEGAANVREIEVGQSEIVLGRGKTCQIILNDKKASRRHASVSRQGSRFVVRDLGSSNGVSVNGEKIREQELAAEDQIRIGDTVILFKAVHVDYALQENDFLTPEPEEEDLSPVVAPLAATVQEMPATPGPGPLESWIPGIQPAANAPSSTGGLLGKWRDLPPRKRILYIAAIGAALFMLFEEEEIPVSTKSEPATKAEGKVQKTEKLFDELSAEQKKYVESQYALAQQLFEAKEFERTYEELTKIFQLIPNFKDARDYERYAKEGIQRVKREGEDRRRREEEERVQAKVAELEADADRLAKEKKWDAVKVILDDIQALDPENAKVIQWKNEISEEVERDRQSRELASMQSDLNQRAVAKIREGDTLVNSERFLAAIQKYREVPQTTPDKKIYSKALKKIASARAALNAKVEPMLADANAREAEGAFGKAYKLYREALRIHPASKPALTGVDRLRGQLMERAKYVYAEAVLAESYSDFDLAAKKFQECMEIAPDDNIYFQRAKRRLNRYKPFTDPSGGGS